MTNGKALAMPQARQDINGPSLPFDGCEAASPKVESGLHNWQLEGSAGVWESYYKCSKCGKGARQDSDGPSLPVDGCEAASPKVPQGVEEGAIEKALRRAFNLGQTYWQQADSESCSQNRKSDETLQKFNTLVVETSNKFSGMVIVPVSAMPAERADKHASERAALYNRGWDDCRSTVLAAAKEKGE